MTPKQSICRVEIDCLAKDITMNYTQSNDKNLMSFKVCYFYCSSENAGPLFKSDLFIDSRAVRNTAISRFNRWY